MPEASRTARDLVSEVNRVATEETERNLRQQEQTVKNFSDPFEEKAIRGANGKTHPGNTGADRSGASMQSGTPPDYQGGREAGKQNADTPAPQAGNRTGGKAS